MSVLGIDVSKAKLDCCLYTLDIQSKQKNKIFDNQSKGLQNLIQWVIQQDCIPEKTHVVLEATSTYHETAAITLHQAGFIVSVVNPAHVRSFAKGLAILTKTDSVDSMVLAKFCALAQPKRWQPPSDEVLLLKALLSRKDALAKDLQREKNRLEKSMATSTPQRILDSINESIHFIEIAIAKLDDDIDQHIQQHTELKKDRDLMQTIPAVGQKTSLLLLSLIRTHQFESAEQLAAYLGLVPIERKSGSSVNGHSHLSKSGDPQIRRVLYMAAVVAVQYNPHISALYARLLKRGKAKMSAIGAAMRKLVHLCFGVVKNQIAYQCDYLITK